MKRLARSAAGVAVVASALALQGAGGFALAARPGQFTGQTAPRFFEQEGGACCLQHAGVSVDVAGLSGSSNALGSTRSTFRAEGSPTGPTLVAAGRKLFLENCAHCHGADARGDDGPDLHGTPVTDEEIADRITRGVPHQMPSFAKKLHEAEIAALTAYIRSLQ